jgi:multidrug efflux pump subunit AcrA (membrane-fusion protein)
MRAVFANEDRSLVPGLFANVRLPAGPPQKALLIPEIVINSDQGRKSVLVVGKNGTVEVRPITIDRAHGTMRAVLGGLAPEDQVIVNGQMMMMPRPGTPVEILPAGGQPAGPAAAAPEAPAAASQESKKQS